MVIAIGICELALANLTGSPLWAAEPAVNLAAGIDPAKLPGIVQDNEAATVTGTWTKSVHTRPFLGAGYLYAAGGADQRVVFSPEVSAAGEYEVLVSYTPGVNRTHAATVIVNAQTEAGEATAVTVLVDQRKNPAGPYSFHSVGKFRFPIGPAKIEVSAEGNKQGVVIADGVQLLTAEQLVAYRAEAAKSPPPLLAIATTVEPLKLNPAPATTPAPAEVKKPEGPKIEQAPAFARKPAPATFASLSPAKLDELLAKELGGSLPGEPISDEAFLRRVTLDVIGRQPTTAEMQAFAADTAADKRAKAIDVLLASADFGRNWASCLSDVISFRTPQPELTFLNFQPFKNWLAEKINANVGWDEISYQMITASGKVGDNPAATYVGFHQGDKSRLAAETTRVFLATQIQCAECHNHKFIDLPQTTFHHVAAFFVRVDAKLPHNDSSAIVVSSRPSGEHKMPDRKEEMQPIAFDQTKGELGMPDVARRTQLAEWIVGPENPWFGKAFTNRVWARLMGRGFCEPVDEIGELGDRLTPDLHAAVAGHFVSTEHDIRGLFRLVLNSAAYQRAIHDPEPSETRPFAIIKAGRLRGEEVFDSLSTGIALPNFTPPATKPTDIVRFPPPPKSTRELVSEAFGFDPSAEQQNVARTMQQAMLMMNNEQIQRQIDARPESGTMLAKLLAAETEDDVVIVQLYQNVLARKPTSDDLEIAKQHLKKLGDRGTAFEDLLWGLINSAEFVARR